MTSLDEWQADLASHLMGAQPPWPPELEVHRNTMLGGWVNALRLIFPSVAQLVGADCFNQLGHDYARSHPGNRAVLDLYGDQFPDYLEGSAVVAGLPYLSDVARFDMALHRTTLAKPSLETRTFGIADGVRLWLLDSVTFLRLKYPADLIRDALQMGREVEAAQVAIVAGDRSLVLWHADIGPMAKHLTAPAGEFLEALVKGQGIETAMTRAVAVEGVAPVDAIAAIQTQILQASFCRLTRDTKPTETT